MNKENNEYFNIMNIYGSNYDSDLGFNTKKCELSIEKKVNTIKKVKKR